MIIPALVLLDIIIGKTISDNSFKIVPPSIKSFIHYHRPYINCKYGHPCNLQECEKELYFKSIDCIDPTHYFNGNLGREIRRGNIY